MPDMKSLTIDGTKYDISGGGSASWNTVNGDYFADGQLTPIAGLTAVENGSVMIISAHDVTVSEIYVAAEVTDYIVGAENALYFGSGYDTANLDVVTAMYDGTAESITFYESVSGSSPDTVFFSIVIPITGSPV